MVNINVAVVRLFVDVVYRSNKSAERSSECYQTFTSADRFERQT